MLTPMHSIARLLVVSLGLVCVLLSLVAAVGSHAASRVAGSTAAVAASPPQRPKPAPVANHITVEDLKKRRWIEGTWRGTGGGVPPFFERYRFENPTTLVVEGLADEKVEKVTETSRFELK